MQWTEPAGKVLWFESRRGAGSAGDRNYVIPQMRLRQSTIISANASAVWPYLADPVLQADWNPKVVSIDRERSGPVRFGERFGMIYRMSGRENQSRVEVTVAQPSECVAFLHRVKWKSAEQIVEESYEISSRGNGVKVVQTINLARAGIPWQFRLLIWFINRFGWNAEQPYLGRLKRLVERPEVAG
jgi:hypothetical protein